MCDGRLILSKETIKKYS